MLIPWPSAIALASAATLAILAGTHGIAHALDRPEIVERSIAAPSSGAPRVVAIGDSIMEGHGLASDEAWLADLAISSAWNFTNLASDGSGFVTRGNDRDTFADQAVVAAKLHPDVIIVSASSNDLGTSDTTIDNSTMSVIQRLHAALPSAKIIAVSAIWGDTDVPSQLAAINAAMHKAAVLADGSYIDVGQPLAGRPDLMQADDVHPTAAGQRVLAASVSQALTSDDVTL